MNAQEPSEQYRLSSPRFRQLGYLTLTGLLLLSLIFFRERAWFLDIAYQTFLLINDGSVQVQVYRFGAALVQALPLLAFKLGAPLMIISALYSASFPILFLLFYFVMVRILRNDLLGLAMVLLFTLIVYDGFYWATNELQQGLAFTLVFFAFILRYPALNYWLHWGFILPGLVALVFYHPLIFIPTFFLWAYFGLQIKELRHTRYLMVAVALIAILYAKQALLPNYYDTQKYNTFYSNLQDYFPNYLSLPAHGIFLRHMLSYWYGFPILLFTLTGYYLSRRKWLVLALVWVTCLGYLFLVHLSDPALPHRFYAEVNYYPLVIIVGVPFLFDWARHWSSRFFFRFLLFTFLFRLSIITLHHKPFTQRLHWLQTTLMEGKKQAASNRYYLPSSQAPLDTLLMTWGTPYETLIMTAAQGPDSVATLFILPDYGDYREVLASDTTLVTEFRPFGLTSLNENYYRLEKGTYILLEK